MVTGTDPARTGVKAGRVVGLLTAALAVATLLDARGSFQEATTLLLEFVGVEPGLSVTALFWGNVLLAGVARYSLCYVVGSLLGVVYDWMDEESPVILVCLAFVVGAVDGLFAAVDTRSAVVGVAYLLVWFAYVPVFVWLHDPGAGDDLSTPRRLGQS
jgi:hypothetical protein